MVSVGELGWQEVHIRGGILWSVTMWEKWELVLSMKVRESRAFGLYHEPGSHIQKNFWPTSEQKRSRHYVVGKPWNFLFIFSLWLHIKHHFTCLFAIHVLSLMLYQFKYFSPLGLYSYYKVLSIYYTFWIQVHSQICDSLSVACVSFSSIASFKEPKYLNTINII